MKNKEKNIKNKSMLKGLINDELLIIFLYFCLLF